jgi:hypothetical protein
MRNIIRREFKKKQFSLKCADSQDFALWAVSKQQINVQCRVRDFNLNLISVHYLFISKRKSGKGSRRKYRAVWSYIGSWWLCCLLQFLRLNYPIDTMPTDISFFICPK